jgi:hypothetical protein
MHVVLAHLRATFHPCTCGLRGGDVVVVAVLIDYDGRGGCCWDGHEEETIVIDYFLYSDTRLCWITTQTLLSLLNASIGNDDPCPLYLQVSWV